jgi:TonB family protein
MSLASPSATPRRLPAPVWAAAAALVLHAGLWAGLQAGRGDWVAPGSGARTTEARAQQALQIRLASPNDVSRVTASAPPPLDESWVTHQTAVPPEPEPEAAADAPATPQAAGTDTYLSRDAVDLGPQPVGLIQIPYPEGVQPATESALQAGQVHTGRLTLYIDENGSVRRVQVHGDELPAPFQEAARNAFLQARFVPGQRMGQPVKVRIDIEVSFDDRDLAPAAARAQARPEA